MRFLQLATCNSATTYQMREISGEQLISSHLFNQPKYLYKIPVKRVRP